MDIDGALCRGSRNRPVANLIKNYDSRVVIWAYL